MQQQRAEQMCRMFEITINKHVVNVVGEERFSRRNGALSHGRRGRHLQRCADDIGNRSMQGDHNLH